ncbi:UvrD-helicase domain-containing protein, partial [Candidatus Microgenomates bacterium]|nr:UvrD-helicase domain-containing protein [Candidatus Microgenomates bacterium]
MIDILTELNSQQQRATTYGDGPLLILAGAGSGKTRALTYRAAYLILEKHIPAENILLLTFTNKAAGEMKERIQRLIASHLSPFTFHLPYAGTFHSFCAKVLRADGDLLGISHNFVIYDEADQADAIRGVIKKLDLSIKEYKPQSVLNTISGAKNELLSELEYPQYARGIWQKNVAQIYLEYQRFLRQNQAVDFDDLIFKVIDLFKKFPEVLGKYQNKYRYLLVDEYQDTNHAQYVLTKLLASRYRNLTVVGDCSQSIYGWRGANFRNLINLKSDFPALKIINLEQNYRSTKTILDVAYSVICHNTTHPILKLWTKNEEGEKIYLYEASSEINEAEFIVNQISRHLDQYRLSDFAILYRTNAQSRVLEEFFLQSGIPYVLVGGTRFYQRKEVKDVLAYLRLIANPKDTVSHVRIEKLGKARLEKFLNWQERNLSKNKRLLTLDLFDELLKATNYLELYDPKDEEDLARLENINELRSVANEFPDLNDFLE